MDIYENAHDYKLIFHSSYKHLESIYNAFNKSNSRVSHLHKKLLSKLRNNTYNQLKITNELVRLSEDILIFKIYKLISYLSEDPELNFKIDSSFTKPYIYIPIKFNGFPEVSSLLITAKPTIKEYLLKGEEPIYELTLVDSYSQPIYIKKLGYEPSYMCYEPAAVIDEIYRLFSYKNYISN